jgi:hypothetical protein
MVVLDWPNIDDGSEGDSSFDVEIPKYTRNLPDELKCLRGKVVESRACDYHSRFGTVEDAPRQIYDFYEGNLKKIKTKYGTVDGILNRLKPFSVTTKAGEYYSDKLLEIAKPGMTSENLHTKFVTEMAEEALTKMLRSHLSFIDANPSCELNRTMLNLAQRIHIFDSAERDSRFTAELQKLFRDSITSYLLNKQ